MTDLLVSAMRLNPMRIVIGEVRDEAAKVMITAFSTGHDGGLTTTHADSPHGGLKRIEVLVEQGGGVPSKLAISEAIHTIIHIKPVSDLAAAKEAGNYIGLKVQTVARVAGLRDGDYLVVKMA